MDSYYWRQFLTPKYILTFTIFFCYFSNAINYSLLSPTLTSMSKLYGIPIDQMSLIFTIRSFSYMIGALSGFGFKYVNREICLIIFTLTMGLTLALLPVVQSLSIFFIIGCINGLMAGGSDTAITAWIIELWDQKSGPFLLGAHFIFGSGNILAPLIARPFVSQDRYHLVIAFVICGSICVVSAVVLTFVLFKRKFKATEESEPNEPSVQNQNQTQSPSISEEIIQESERREMKPIFGVIVAVIGCLLLATYTAMEMTYFTFEPTFVQYSRYNMSAADATVLSSATSAVYTLTRGVEILLALKISSHSILFVHFVIIIVFNLVAIFTYNLPIVWVWVSNLGIAVGCGSVYPQIYTFLQQNFNIDNKKTAILLFVGGATGAIYPYIVGNSIESKPLVFIYVNVISIIFCILFLFSIKFITTKFGHIVRPQQVLTTADL